jgi:hypothetical protein
MSYSICPLSCCSAKADENIEAFVGSYNLDWTAILSNDAVDLKTEECVCGLVGEADQNESAVVDIIKLRTPHFILTR